VQGIKDVLLPTVAAWMAGNHVVQVENVDPKRIGLDHQVPIGLIGRYRVAVSVELHLPEAIEGDRFDHTAFEILLREGQQVGLLHLPRLGDGHPLAVHTPLTIGQAGR